MEEQTLYELEQMDHSAPFAGQPNSICNHCEIMYCLRNKKNPLLCPICKKLMKVEEKKD